jgi:hypothetical protein
MPAGPRAQDGEVVILFRGDRDSLYVLDTDERSYLEIDPETASRLAGQIGNVMGEVREQMKGMSPETRRQMEEVMAQIGVGDVASEPETIRAVATGKTSTVSGRICREHAILRSERRIGDICIADWGVSGVSRADLEPLRRLVTLQENLAAAMPLAGLRVVTIDPGAVSTLDGVPLRVRLRDNDQPETDTRVVAIERGDIATDAFQPPAGWTRRSWFLE